MPETARREAIRLLGDIAKEDYPADHRDAGRKAFTIAERAEAYFAEGNKRARYAAGYRYM